MNTPEPTGPTEILPESLARFDMVDSLRVHINEIIAKCNNVPEANWENSVQRARLQDLLNYLLEIQ